MKFSKGLIVLAAGAWLMSLPVQAACPLGDPALCIYVDVQNCVDPGAGTQADPFCSIQTALDLSFPLDTILVLPGTYAECVSSVGLNKPIALIADAFLEDPTNPASRELTIIDGSTICDGTTIDPDTGISREEPVVLIGANNPTATRVEGFTITGGAVSGVAARGGVTITNNIIRNNSSPLGGGVYLYTASCDYPGAVNAFITNNDIRENIAEAPTDNTDLEAAGDGGGVYVLAQGAANGVNCFGGDVSVTISDNTIEDNSVKNQNTNSQTGGLFSTFGGGVVANCDSDITSTTQVVVTQNTIRGNGPAAGSITYGGGLWALTYGFGDEIVDITENNVTLNNATADGGGISAWSNSQSLAGHFLTLENNSVTTNTAGANGGGLDLFVFAADLGPNETVQLTASRNRVSGNRSEQGFIGGGGGILTTVFVDRSSADDVRATVSENEITNNSAQVSGGGASMVVFADADPLSDFSVSPPICSATLPASANVNFVGNMVADNSVTGIVDPLPGDPVEAGGGVFAYVQSFGEATASININECTIAGNSSVSASGGVEVEATTDFDCILAFEGAGEVNVTNSIIADNAGLGIGGPPAGSPGVINTTGGDTHNLTFDVTYSDVVNNTPSDYERVELENPAGNNISADPLFADGASGDYRLSGSSPAIDAGDPGATGLTGFDFEGDARVVNGTVDMGADEFFDSDSDGTQNSIDNCPFAANPGQEDSDGDELGNVCDPCTDADDDGYGLTGNTACTLGAGDCDDTVSTVFPGAPEICDGNDNDCNSIDDDLFCDDFDVNGDLVVNGAELAWLGRGFGLTSSDSSLEWWGPVDYNRDNMIDGVDLSRLGLAWNCSGTTNVCQ